LKRSAELQISAGLVLQTVSRHAACWSSLRAGLTMSVSRAACFLTVTEITAHRAAYSCDHQLRGDGPFLNNAGDGHEKRHSRTEYQRTRLAAEGSTSRISRDFTPPTGLPAAIPPARCSGMAPITTRSTTSTDCRSATDQTKDLFLREAALVGGLFHAGAKIAIGSVGNPNVVRSEKDFETIIIAQRQK
jgi:hypothetical protein